MKTLKNLEAMFVVAVALACSASYVSQVSEVASSQPQSGQTAQANVQAIPVITITAKRMTAQEKQLSLLEERQELARVATASAL